MNNSNIMYATEDRLTKIEVTFDGLLAFDQVYEAVSKVRREEFVRAFIERIELFPEKQPDGSWIRKIIFNFLVPVNRTEEKELSLENETMVEMVVMLFYKKQTA